tara:strand:+ start:1130 stop:1423 length:294 start_codon:yes stop_codon:yes gene_type:complete
MIEPPYNFKFHAEIRYETEECFNFTNANGNTIGQIKEDILRVCIKYEKRSPKIVTILGKSEYNDNYNEYIYLFANHPFFIENESVKNALSHITKVNV